MPVNSNKSSLNDKSEAATPRPYRELKKSDRHDHHSGGP